MLPRWNTSDFTMLHIFRQKLDHKLHLKVFVPALAAGGDGKHYRFLEYAIAFWLSSRTLRPSSKDS